MAQVGVLAISRAAGGAVAVSPANPEFRSLIGMDGWAWVRDTAVLARRLDYAGTWGYNTFVFSFEAPSSCAADGDSNWVRDSAKGMWRLARGGHPGVADARSVLQCRIRDVKSVAERREFRFVSLCGPLGWGGMTSAIDPSAAAGTWYDLTVPARATNRFRLRSGNSGGAVLALSHWGNAPGAASFDTTAGGGIRGGLIRPARAGRVPHQAHFILQPGMEAYWTLAIDAEGQAAAPS